MRLIERIDAFDLLERLIDTECDDALVDKLVELYDYIEDVDNDGAHREGRRSGFDFYIDGEFPNGVEKDEFTDFCANHQDEIIENVK